MAVGIRRAASAGVAGALLLVFPVVAHARTTNVFMGVPTKKVQNQLGAIATKSDPRAFMDINDFFPHGVTIHVGDTVASSITDRVPHRRPAQEGQATAAADFADGHAGVRPGRRPGPAVLVQRQAPERRVHAGPAQERVRQGVQVPRHQGGQERPSARPPEAADHQIHKARHLHLLLQHPCRDEGRGAGRAQGPQDPGAPTRQAAPDCPGQARPQAGAQPRRQDVGAHEHARRRRVGGPQPRRVLRDAARQPLRQGRHDPHASGWAPEVTDVHTAAFGTDDPGAQPPNPAGYLTTLASTFQGIGPFDPRAVWASNPPTATATLSPKSHGNGFWNTGVMDTAKGGPLPASGKVTFSTPGTYHYYCMIHPYMHGTITGHAVT